jgi:hypothetical protein
MKDIFRQEKIASHMLNLRSKLEQKERGDQERMIWNPKQNVKNGHFGLSVVQSEQKFVKIEAEKMAHEIRYLDK